MIGGRGGLVAMALLGLGCVAVACANGDDGSSSGGPDNGGAEGGAETGTIPGCTPVLQRPMIP